MSENELITEGIRMILANLDRIEKNLPHQHHLIDFDKLARRLHRKKKNSFADHHDIRCFLR